jgi:hypothetical protein
MSLSCCLQEATISIGLRNVTAASEPRMYQCIEAFKSATPRFFKHIIERIMEGIKSLLKADSDAMWC